MPRNALAALGLALLVAGCDHASTPTELKGPATSAQLSQLGSYGTVLDQIP